LWNNQFNSINILKGQTVLSAICVLFYSNHQALEEKIEVTSRRAEKLDAELRQREKEMDEANLQRTALQKDIQQLKQASKGKTTITRFTSLKMSSVYWLLSIWWGLAMYTQTYLPQYSVFFLWCPEWDVIVLSGEVD
jgi:hypothetical protein